MTVDEALLPYAVSVTQAVFTIGSDNDPVPTSSFGVTWKRTICPLSDRTPCHPPILIKACPQDGLKQLFAMGTLWIYLTQPTFRFRHLGAAFARVKEKPVHDTCVLA